MDLKPTDFRRWVVHQTKKRQGLKTVVCIGNLCERLYLVKDDVNVDTKHCDTYKELQECG